MTDKPKRPRGRPASGSPPKSGAQRQRLYRQRQKEMQPAPDAVNVEILSLRDHCQALETEAVAFANERNGLLKRIKELETINKRYVTENKNLKNKVVDLEERNEMLRNRK